MDYLKPCLQDEERRVARAAELQAIANADQEARASWQNLTPVQLVEMAKTDIVRRKRVGEIFGEGCFSKAEDYAAAALVFQHGDTPDHFYQTFIWSKRGVELGDSRQKSLMALGLDRYLVNSGRKQLFASQAQQATVGDCYCLQQVEQTFPDKLRQEYTGRTIHDALKWVDSINAGKKCESAQECVAELKPTPKGSVPGFW